MFEGHTIVPRSPLCRAILILAALVASAAPGFAPASEPDPPGVMGYWLSSEKKVAVKIYPCKDKDKLCGRIVWLAKPYHRSGKFKRDKKNPDPSLRHRGWCGIEVIRGLRKKSDTRWEKGRFYYPRKGTTFDIDIELKDEDELELRAYMGFRFLGKSDTWIRPGAEEVKDFACVPPPSGI